MSKEVEVSKSSVVQVRIGNRPYDMVRSPRCGTCMHPARFQVEAKLLLNYGYPAISRFVSGLVNEHRDGTQEEWPELTPAQIRHHFESGHCSAEGEVGRALATQRAADRGIDLENSMTEYTDHIIVQQAIMRRGYELLVEGKIEPDVKDLLAASKLIGDAELDGDKDATEAQWREYMQIYFDAVSSVVEPHQQAAIIKAIKEHPAYLAMNKTNNAEPIDAEVEDE